MRSLKLAFILCLMTLVGCSSLSAVSFLTGLVGEKPGISVDTELVVGDKKQDVEVQIGTTQSQMAATINNDNAPPVLISLLILGWLLPTPGAMFKWLLGLIPFLGKKKR